MKILLFALLLFFLILFMIAPRYSKKEQWQKFREYEYAHRGLHHDGICENSLAAYRECIRYGYGFEFDVQRTKDDVLIIMHDENLKRACNVDRKISECTYDEIKDLTLFDTDSHIPLFKEVLETVKGQIPLIVEVKQFTNDTRVCELVAEQLDEYDGLFCVESFHPLAVKWFKDHRPDYVRGQLSRDYHEDKDINGPVLAFLLEHLLTNVMTRPDFVAYKVEDRNRNLGFNIYRDLLKGKTVLWTIRDIETFRKCEKDYGLLIFERFITDKKSNL